MSVLPDGEALLIQALKAKSEISTRCGGRISTRLSTAVTAIRIAHIGGGGRVTANTGLPNFQAECWGADEGPAAETAACDLARYVEASVDSLPGVYAAGRIVAAYPIGDLIHSPDGTSGRQRYIVQIGLLTQ